MPWPVFRHMEDQQLWDNTVEKIRTYPAAAFPTANEVAAAPPGHTR